MNLSKDELKELTKYIINEYEKHHTKERQAEILEILEMFSNRHKQVEQDQRLYNTEQLLKHYREFKEYNEHAIYDTAQLAANGADDIMQIMDPALEVKVKSIEEGVAVTRIIMEHVDTVLQGYEARCRRSNKPEVRRRWRELYALRLSPEDEKLTAEQIAEKENIGVTTFYDDMKIVCKDLGPLLFGLNGSDFKF